MTCVPDTLLRVLRRELASAGVRNRSDMSRFVRDRSRRFEGKVTVNGVRPTEKQAAEVREWLRGFNANQNGQLVSAFDPLLMLLAETTYGCSHRARLVTAARAKGAHRVPAAVHGGGQGGVGEVVGDAHALRRRPTHPHTCASYSRSSAELFRFRVSLRDVISLGDASRGYIPFMIKL